MEKAPKSGTYNSYMIPGGPPLYSEAICRMFLRMVVRLRTMSTYNASTENCPGIAGGHASRAGTQKVEALRQHRGLASQVELGLDIFHRVLGRHIQPESLLFISCFSHDGESQVWL